MTERALTSSELARLEEEAVTRQEGLRVQLLEVEAQRAQAEKRRREAEQMETARKEHLERCKLDFVKAVDVLMAQKLSALTFTGVIAFAHELRAKQAAFRSAVLVFDQGDTANLRAAGWFADRVIGGHPSNTILQWLLPLLNVRNA